MKKKLPIILLGVILACVLVFGFLYANNDIGKTANSLEADIRQSQKILDDWIVDGSISDTMAAFISYPQDKTDHTFSVYEQYRNQHRHLPYCQKADWQDNLYRPCPFQRDRQGDDGGQNQAYAP